MRADSSKRESDYVAEDSYSVSHSSCNPFFPISKILCATLVVFLAECFRSHSSTTRKSEFNKFIFHQPPAPRATSIMLSSFSRSIPFNLRNSTIFPSIPPHMPSSASRKLTPSQHFQLRKRTAALRKKGRCSKRDCKLYISS